MLAEEDQLTKKIGNYLNTSGIGQFGHSSWNGLVMCIVIGDNSLAYPVGGFLVHCRAPSCGAPPCGTASCVATPCGAPPCGAPPCGAPPC